MKYKKRVKVLTKFLEENSIPFTKTKLLGKHKATVLEFYCAAIFIKKECFVTVDLDNVSVLPPCPYYLIDNFRSIFSGTIDSVYKSFYRELPDKVCDKAIQSYTNKSCQSFRMRITDEIFPDTLGTALITGFPWEGDDEYYWDGVYQVVVPMVPASKTGPTQIIPDCLEEIVF